MDKKRTQQLFLVIAAAAIVLLFFPFNNGSGSGLEVTVYSPDGLPVGSTAKSWDKLAFIYVDPGEKLIFEQGYSVGINAIVKMSYNIAGSAGGTIVANWNATGSFIDAAKSSATPPPSGQIVSGSKSAAITSAGTATIDLTIPVGQWAYSSLDEDIPSTGAKPYTMTFAITAQIKSVDGTVLKSVTATQSVTITLEGTVSGDLTIVSIAFSPWIETPSTGFF